MNEKSISDENYELLDSGGGRVLERIGDIVTSRASHAAWWRRKLPGAEWRKAVELKHGVKEPVRVKIGPVCFQITPGSSLRALAPELKESWELVARLCSTFADKHRAAARVLNLFGGAGGFTMAAAQSGAVVTHVDAAADGIKRAREHVLLNVTASRDIRWVVDDPVKFAQRERLQNGRYDLIVIDPYVPKEARRGAMELERDLGPLLATVSGLLSDKALAVLVLCRQGGASPTTLGHLMRQEFSVFGGIVEAGEILLRGTAEAVPDVPSGAFARWQKAI